MPRGIEHRLVTPRHLPIANIIKEMEFVFAQHQRSGD
jgi:hypothetical protein